MTYDSGLAHRIREALPSDVEFEEREMFGGLGWMMQGNMCCGVIDDRLIARVGAEAYDNALKDPHASEFDYTGRAMTGWVFVDHAGLGSEVELEMWLQRCVRFARSLQSK